jgi:alpha-beta hydrolase superfamily lysophospholipase
MSCVSPVAPPDKAQFQLLAQSLPDLAFDPAANTVTLARQDVQEYLGFYRINFAAELGVSQGLGAVDLAGYRIAVQYWIPQNPKGTLVVVHGYYDHTGVFGRAIRFGLDQGFAVLMFDLPGHGLSSGERVAIGSFDEYADVLAGMVQKAQPHLPVPFHILAQSTGAATFLNYLWRYPEQASQFKRIALCAPLLLPRAWKVGKYVYAMARLVCRRVKRGVSRSSHDPQFIHFLDYLDPLQEKNLPLRWVGAMKAWDRQFRGFAAKDTRLLIVQGTNDMTVDWRYNLPVIQRKLPNAQVELIPDAGHQLVNESDTYRIPVFAKISRYFFDE